MKKRILLIFISLLIFIIFSPVNSKSATGIGIIVGEPTGISLKFDNFPVLGIAWSFNGYININCDYWIKNSNLEGPLNWYLGIGGSLLLYSAGKSDNTGIGLGARVPIGLQMFFADNLLELFGEIVPSLLVIPATGFGIDAGIGIRAYIF